MADLPGFIAASVMVIAMVIGFSRGTKMEIEDRVIKCVSQLVGIPAEDITTSMGKDDLAMDSLDEIELIMDLEDEFGIEIPDEVMTEFKTVGGLISYIHLRVPV